MMKFNSIGGWRNYCFNTHTLYLNNEHFRKWINEKDIGIFNLSHLANKDIKHLRLGIEDAIRTVMLHFKIYYNYDNAVKKIVGPANKKISSSKLLKIIIQKRKYDKREHADIFILNNPIKSTGAIIKDGEALTYVPEGVMIFSIDALKKYPHDFLRRRGKHEALHLLGLNSHHNDTRVEGYDCTHCVMQYNAPTSRLCRKCKDGLVYFWKGVEFATKRKLIKNKIQ